MDDVEGRETIMLYFKAIKELRPKIFFFENVHGFVYKPHRESLEYLEEQSKKLDYEITYDVVNCANFGVPQTRERFICIGVDKKLPKFEFPETTHSNKNSLLQKWITAGDVLNDLDYDLEEDQSMLAGSKDHELLKQIPPGDNYLFFTKERNHPNPIFRQL